MRRFSLTLTFFDILIFVISILLFLSPLILNNCGELKLAESEKGSNAGTCDVVYYKDMDRDLFSDGITSCEKKDGYYTKDELKGTEGDCDDSDPNVFPTPGTTVICKPIQ